MEEGYPVSMLIVIAFVGLAFVAYIVYLAINGGKKGNKYIEARNTVEQKLKAQGFNIEKQVGVTAKLYVDNTQKLWAVKEWNESTEVKIYKYSDLVDFELLEDEQSIIKGSAGEALVGGVLGGTTGAIIGGSGSRQVKQNVSLLEVRIRTNDFEHLQYSIQFIKGYSLSKTGSGYKKMFESAQEVVSVLSFISANGEVEQKNQTGSVEGVGEKIRELYQLKNEGIITLEEFEKKKKDLLNL